MVLQSSEGSQTKGGKHPFTKGSDITGGQAEIREVEVTDGQNHFFCI